MGDVGIESTLVLDGLAVSKVRFYSTLNSDVGKRVEIIDKFNHSNVFTGTFDASLNLLYDLPAFTSYQVKMYGLDGETVESDQTFMLKGYDYLEKNVGLNKNSFAGIKAIVDQGLENSMLEVGHEFSEDDGVGDNGGRWIIVAIGVDKYYNHSVYLCRKYIPPFTVTMTMNTFAEAFSYLNGSYLNGMPESMKNSITVRTVKSSRANAGNIDPTMSVDNVKIWWPSWYEFRGGATCPVSTYTAVATNAEKRELSYFPYFSNNAFVLRLSNDRPASMYFRSLLYNNAFSNAIDVYGYGRSNLTGNDYAGINIVASTDQPSTYLLPCCMIASDPIE